MPLLSPPVSRRGSALDLARGAMDELDDIAEVLAGAEAEAANAIAAVASEGSASAAHYGGVARLHGEVERLRNSRLDGVLSDGIVSKSALKAVRARRRELGLRCTNLLDKLEGLPAPATAEANDRYGATAGLTTARQKPTAPSQDALAALNRFEAELSRAEQSVVAVEAKQTAVSPSGIKGVTSEVNRLYRTVAGIQLNGIDAVLANSPDGARSDTQQRRKQLNLKCNNLLDRLTALMRLSEIELLPRAASTPAVDIDDIIRILQRAERCTDTYEAEYNNRTDASPMWRSKLLTDKVVPLIHTVVDLQLKDINLVFYADILQGGAAGRKASRAREARYSCFAISLVA